MNELVIHISWQWGLGIIGALIAFAWKVNARFTAVETSIRGMARTIHDIKSTLDRFANERGG